MSLLSIHNLHKKYGEATVLDGIDLEVNSGDVIAVLGPSGSGKTTLLRCLNFLEKANEGTLIFDREKHNLATIQKKEIEQIRKKTAFVFQNFNLFANKTALENVTLGLTVGRGLSKAESEKIGLSMLKKVGLEDKKDAYPIALSGGQQQRVAIARALAVSPEIIYFDEPTSALDPELIGEVLGVIKQLSAEGMTMLIVTHEINFARNVANKIVFLDQGQILSYTDSESFFINQKNERISDFLKSITAPK